VVFGKELFRDCSVPSFTDTCRLDQGRRRPPKGRPRTGTLRPCGQPPAIVIGQAHAPGASLAAEAPVFFATSKSR
jgi:hypothetical protein